MRRQRQRQEMFLMGGGGVIIFLNIKIEFQRALLVAEAV